MSAGISYEFSVEGKSIGLDETNAKMGKAEQLLSKLDKTVESMSPKLKTATGHLGKHADGFKGVGHAVDEAHGKMTHFLEFIGASLAVEGIKKITEGVTELGGEILKASGDAEKMALSLKLNVGVESAKGVLEWIDEIASKTAFTDDQLKGWSNQLLKSGVAMKDLKSYIAAGLDLAAKGGDMGSVIEALTRAKISGKIGVRQLVAAGIPIKDFAALPEYAGLSEKALGKKVESGSITTDQIIQVAAGKNGIVGDLGIEAGGLLDSKLKNLRTLPDQYFQKFADSASFDRMKSKLDDMFKSLDPESERGKKIFDSMDKAFTRFVDTLAKIDLEKLANGLDKMVVALGKLANFAGGATSKMIDAVGNTPADVDAAKKAWEDKARAQIGGKSYAERFSDWLSGADAAGADAGGKIAQGLAKGIEGKADHAAGAAKGLVDDTSNAVIERAEIHSPSKLFERHGRNVGRGFAKGIEGERANIDDVMAGAFAVPAPDGGRTVAANWGAPNVTIEINVDGHGKGDRELAQLIVSEVAAVVPSMLLGAFEESNKQSGSD